MRFNVTLESKQAVQSLYSYDWTLDLEVQRLKVLGLSLFARVFQHIPGHSEGRMREVSVSTGPDADTHSPRGGSAPGLVPRGLCVAASTAVGPLKGTVRSALVVETPGEPTPGPPSPSLSEWGPLTQPTAPWYGV